MNKYYCRISGSDSYEEYYDENHISAAKRYALDLSEMIERENPELYIKGVKIEVMTEDGRTYYMDIDYVHIRKI